MMKPSQGRIIKYRGKYGDQNMYTAIVTLDLANLNPKGVERGEVDPIDSDMHVHLQVFSPNRNAQNFAEHNVPFGIPGEDGMIPPGTWAWPTIKN